MFDKIIVKMNYVNYVWELFIDLLLIKYNIFKLLIIIKCFYSCLYLFNNGVELL